MEAAERTDRELLEEMSVRLKKMERRQSVHMWVYLSGVLLTLVVFVTAAVLITPPLLRMAKDYKATMDKIDEVTTAVSKLDMEKLGTAIGELDNLNLGALGDTVAEIQSLDWDVLKESVSTLNSIDLAGLNNSLDSMKNTINSLSGLDTAGINAAVEKLNTALEPIVKLFS